MPRTENTEYSLSAPVQQAALVAQPTGNRCINHDILFHG
jgi:hypothetical protein